MSSNDNTKKSSSHFCRDEVKREKREDSKRMKIINNVTNLTTAMSEKPSMWMLPEFA